MEAIRKPASIKYRENAWTFTDVVESSPPGLYIFGRLSKYAPEGEVGVVDEASKSEKKRSEPNLLVASSPFIYIPDHSGIAFLNVSGSIEPWIFSRRFSQIIEKTYDDFFVDCEIKFVTDLKTFSNKISSLDGIYKIEARISPPNPLFGPLWKRLEEYLRGRNVDRMTLVEDAPLKRLLKTELPTLVKEASEQTSEKPFDPGHLISIGDAAVLMAADGYGLGKITGRNGGETVVIKTSETSINFTFSKTPEPYELYIRALEIFNKIKEDRHMEHGQ
ncbi:hypothetical protein ISP19_04750 [Dyella flava]|uniref:Uncharacterized protein n=2 Tax=Dyella flava TaxID=1920170 RepID=A0ABS2K0A8_9GAMM|nr:hypothetical protein [Dyella flava]